MTTTRAGERVARQKGASTPPDSYFRRLAVVFADPIRLKIVTELFLREMSPKQFFRAHGGGSLNRVAAHFKRLQDVGWLRLVREEKGDGRRGGTEHFYRAPQLAIFDNESWAQLPESVKVEFSWRIFEQFAERVKEAFEAGTLDARSERHFAWLPLVLDQEGRARVIQTIDSLFETLFEEQADARVRLSRSGDVPMHATVGLAAFDSPRRERNRSGLILPTPDPKQLVSEQEFLARLARIFRNEVNLKIVTELNLREMSPSQFAREFGGAWGTGNIAVYNTDKICNPMEPSCKGDLLAAN